GARLWARVALGRFRWLVGAAPDGRLPPLVFTGKESNSARVFGASASLGYFKAAFHEYVIEGKQNAINPTQTGTKTAAHYTLTIAPGGVVVLLFRLCAESDAVKAAFPADAAGIFQQRIEEATAFHTAHTPP